MSHTAAVLMGLTVTDYRRVTSEELRALSWCHPLCWGEDPHVLVLSNGLKLFASRDEEGNGPGSMFVLKEDEGLLAVDGVVLPAA